LTTHRRASENSQNHSGLRRGLEVLRGRADVAFFEERELKDVLPEQVVLGRSVFGVCRGPLSCAVCCHWKVVTAKQDAIVGAGPDSNACHIVGDHQVLRVLGYCRLSTIQSFEMHMSVVVSYTISAGIGSVCPRSMPFLHNLTFVELEFDNVRHDWSVARIGNFLANSKQ
jgi:hypothetical protein